MDDFWIFRMLIINGNPFHVQLARSTEPRRYIAVTVYNLRLGAELFLVCRGGGAAHKKPIIAFRSAIIASLILCCRPICYIRIRDPTNKKVELLLPSSELW